MAVEIDTTCRPQKRAFLVWLSRNSKASIEEVTGCFDKFWKGEIKEWRCIGNGFDTIWNLGGKIHVAVDTGDYITVKQQNRIFKKLELINEELEELISSY